MQISISERHTSASDKVKDYAREKAGKLLKYYDRISQIEVILDGDHNREAVEFIVHVEGAERFVAAEDSSDFLAGVDLVMDRLERQLTRHKEKHRNRKHTARNPIKE